MWQNLLTKIKQAVSGSSLLHGAYTTTLVAIAKVLYPIAEAWTNGSPTPPFNWTSTWHSIVGVFVGYILKNAIFGSSAKPIIQDVSPSSKAS